MGDSIKTHCAACERTENNHQVLFHKEVTEDLDDSPNSVLYSKYNFYVVQCLGCETISYLKTEEYSNEYDEEGNSIIHTYHFPPPQHPDNDLPEDFEFLSFEELDYLPEMLQSLYEEVEGAFDNQSSVLAGIGLRTLVEAICIQQEIEGRNLKRKIEGLFEKGLISKAELPFLDKLRLIGNVSAHRIKSIEIEMLSYALEIVNHVLKSIYILPVLTQNLKI